MFSQSKETFSFYDLRPIELRQRTKTYTFVSHTQNTPTARSMFRHPLYPDAKGREWTHKIPKKLQ